MALVFIFLQQCQDKWNICVGEEEGGFGCLPKYYECLNEYTVSSRKIENEEYVIIQPSMVNCDTKNLLPPPLKNYNITQNTKQVNYAKEENFN